MATNEILPFASTITGTNLLTQAEYTADAQRDVGHQPGIARSKLENKVLRQTSLLSAGLAEFIADYQSNDVNDSLTVQNIADYLVQAIKNANIKGAQYFSSNGIFTVPMGVNEIQVEVWGGGGGGAGGDSVFRGGGGGGGGGYSTRRIIGLVPGQTIEVTVGAGGAGGGYNTNGLTGGTSFFGSFCSATGGQGGLPFDFVGKMSKPVNGGTGIGGDLNLRGGCGMVQTEIVGGNGGDAARGSGGGRGAWQGDFSASAGAAPGGGGGGGDGPLQSAAGGQGGVWVRWGY